MRNENKREKKDKRIKKRERRWADGQEREN